MLLYAGVCITCQDGFVFDVIYPGLLLVNFETKAPAKRKERHVDASSHLRRLAQTCPHLRSGVQTSESWTGLRPNLNMIKQKASHFKSLQVSATQFQWVAERCAHVAKLSTTCVSFGSRFKGVTQSSSFYKYRNFLVHTVLESSNL